MVKEFQRINQVNFSTIDPDLCCWYIIETPQTGIEFEKHLLHTVPLGLGISRKSCLFKEKRFRGDLFFDVLGLF